MEMIAVRLSYSPTSAGRSLFYIILQIVFSFLLLLFFGVKMHNAAPKFLLQFVQCFA